jgi:ABC-type glycerol-3-phosphate transport system substrate-binding protein
MRRCIYPFVLKEKRMKKAFLSFLLLVTLIIAACGGGDGAATSVPVTPTLASERTAEPESTAEAQPTAEILPTNTPETTG